MIDLDELERLWREAEQGEWRTHGPSKPQSDSPEGGDFAIVCGSDIIAETFFRSDHETTHNAEANAALIAALRNDAKELIAMARQADALHAAVCQAVALLNRFPGISHEVYEAHGRLRTALSDYADAMQEQER